MCVCDYLLIHSFVYYTFIHLFSLFSQSLIRFFALLSVYVCIRLSIYLFIRSIFEICSWMARTTWPCVQWHDVEARAAGGASQAPTSHAGLLAQRLPVSGGRRLLLATPRGRLAPHAPGGRNGARLACAQARGVRAARVPAFPAPHDVHGPRDGGQGDTGPRQHTSSNNKQQQKMSLCSLLQISDNE